MLRSTLRWPGGILLAAILIVALVEHVVLPDPTPLMSRFDTTDRVDFYKQVAGMAASALGFLVASVAILVSLDPTRRIVSELRRGESFRLLVANLLAACLWLLVIAVLALAGWAFDSAFGDSDLYQSVFEVVGYAAIAELAIGGFFFGLVTYKVAKYE